jgi:glucose-1-phosphate thymidylyltransferase
VSDRKGIILAGGYGTRLYPVTKIISKQLMPVYDKPMIYYPISTLMLAGIRDILIISTPQDTIRFEELLGDGSDWGINFTYIVQSEPKGLAEAFILGETFINNHNSALILGDNIFYGENFQTTLNKANKNQDGSVIFAYHVNNPEDYGIVELNNSGKAISIEEKPNKPKSNYAVTGLYFYDTSVVEYAKEISPSQRGELEITDINNIYIKKNKMKVIQLNRGYAWLDTGSHDSLLEAGQFISTIQKRQGLMLSCPEEIAYNKKWIDEDQLLYLARKNQKNNYGKYLINLKNLIKN